MYNEKTNISYYPGHMEKTKRLMMKEYNNIDLVYEIVDSRMPKSSKISNIYDIIRDKPKILIMSKKDLADPILVDKWRIYYEHLGTKVIPVNINDDNDIRLIINMTHSLMEEIQLKRENKGMNKKVVHVLVIGIPNVGKSTLINRLVGRKVANTGNKPGITKNLSWLKTNHDILLLDTPGILWPKLENKEVALNLASFSAIKSEVLDVNEVGVHILNKLNRYYPSKLQERYGITPTNMDIDIENVYNTIGKNIGAIKSGEVDYERVSNRIINDIKDEYIKGIVFDNEI